MWGLGARVGPWKSSLQPQTLRLSWPGPGRGCNRLSSDLSWQGPGVLNTFKSAEYKRVWLVGGTFFAVGSPRAKGGENKTPFGMSRK